MRRIKGLVAVLLAVCTVFSVTGCDTVERIKERISQETVDDEKVADENKTEVSNSISVGLLDFDTFNPLLTKSETVKECMEFVYEPLFELNEKLQAVPILAESYTVSPDGRTIDITLKNNIQWQDGSNFNAYDVSYTFKQIRSSVTNYTSVLANMADYMATGDYTFQIVLNYAVPNFVSLLTFPIVKYQSDMKGNANYIPMGTGPYKYNSQLSTGKLLFSAFDNYHNGRAKIDSLYAYTVPDLQKYESMFEASEIDLMTGRTVDLSEYTPRGSARNNEYITNQMTFIGYNTANPLLSGVETRQGLSNIVDKDSIVNSTIYSRGKASNIPINPSSIFYYDTSTKFKPDEILTTQHLGNDKWGLDNDGKYVRHVGAQKQVLQFEILTNSDSAEKVNIANEVADSYTRFGIPTTVTALPYDEYIARINAKNYDIMIGEIEVSANNDLTPLVSSTDNYFSYANPDLDMLIGQLGMTNDEEQQKALFRQYGDIIVNDMPFTVLFFRKGNVMSGSKIKSEILPSVDRMFRNIETWSVTE